MSRKVPEKSDFAPMAEADKLCDLLFLWLRKRKQCAEKLLALAKELENVHEISTVSQVVGSATSVVALSTAGIVTLLTGGLAAPLLVATTVGSIAGAAVNIGSSAIEAIMSGSTMKEAKNIIREDEKIGKDIQEAIENLKKKCGVQQNGAHGPTDVGCEVATQIMGALARRNNIKVPLNFLRSNIRSTFDQNSVGSHAAGAVSQQLTFAAVTFLCYQLGIECFMKGLKSSAKGLGKSVASTGAKGLGKSVASTGAKGLGKSVASTGAKGLGKSVASSGAKGATKAGLKLLGVIGFGISLYSLISSCEEMLKSKQGTKASRALRNAASEIQKAIKSLEEQLDAMKTMLQEIEQKQQELQKIKQEEQKTKEIFFFFFSLCCPVADWVGACISLFVATVCKTIALRVPNKVLKLKLKLQEQQELQEVEQDPFNPFKQKRKKSYLCRLCLFVLCLFVLFLFVLFLFKQKEQEKSSEEAPAVNVGLLNVHSIQKKKEKRIEIKNLIREHKLDVFLITETWLKKETADEALSEASPPNFQFHHECRDTDTRGGGVAIQYSHVFQVFCSRRIGLNSITIFEYVAATLRHEKWGEDVVFITVYNPPKTLFLDFLEEFKRLLNEASKHNRVIVAGDFNFNVKNNNSSKKPSKDQIKDFKTAFKTRGFKQHVDEPTRNSSTLDLVFSRNVEVSDKIEINRDKYKDSDRYISDHSTVYFSIRPKSKDAKTKANL